MQASMSSFSRYLSRNVLRRLAILGGAFILAACGGGGGDDGGAGGGGSGNGNLVINAGLDATVTEGVTYSLSAEVSGGDGTYTYNWSASPSLAITHDDTSSSAASFVAPLVNSATEYTLTVSVNDQSGNTASDVTVITVAPVNIAPVASIDVPAWDGLPANTFPGGVEIVFDGTGSSDADSTSTTVEIADYVWTQTSGTNVITGVETNLSTLTIVTPIANDAQQLTFQLEVTDSEGATDTDTVT